MIKLFCAKVSHKPYKLEMVIEIPEKIFEIDGYEVAERLLEGIPFNVYFDNNQITKVEISDKDDKDYFEDNFNSKRWYEEVKKYAKSILKEGDEVEVPKFIKDKYFKNGINVAYIENV